MPNGTGGMEMLEIIHESEIGEKLYHLFEKLGGLYPSKGTIFLPENDQKEELRKAFEVYLENGKIDSAQAVANLLPESCRIEWLIKVFDEYRRKGYLTSNEYRKKVYLTSAEDVAKLLPEPHRTEKLKNVIEAYLENGFNNNARSTANLLAEPQRTEEFARIIEKYIKKGLMDDARKTADILLEFHKK